MNVKKEKTLRKLSILLIVLGVAASAFGSIATDFAKAANSPAGIYINNNKYYFSQKEVEQKGEYLTHTFRIYNARPRWIEVNAEPDCGCTSTSWKTAQIAPLSWKNLTVSVKRTTFQSPAKSVNVALRVQAQHGNPHFLFVSVNS